MSIPLQCQKHFLRSGFPENRYCQFIDWNCIYIFSIAFVQARIPDGLVKIVNGQCVFRAFVFDHVIHSHNVTDFILNLSGTPFFIRRSIRIGSLLKLYSGFNSSRSMSSWNSSPAAAQNAGCHWSLSGAFFKLLSPVCVNHDPATLQFVFCAQMLSFHLFSIFPPQSFPTVVIAYVCFYSKHFPKQTKLPIHNFIILYFFHML